MQEGQKGIGLVPDDLRTMSMMGMAVRWRLLILLGLIGMPTAWAAARYPVQAIAFVVMETIAVMVFMEWLRWHHRSWRQMCRDSDADMTVMMTVQRQADVLRAHLESTVTEVEPDLMPRGMHWMYGESYGFVAEYGLVGEMTADKGTFVTIRDRLRDRIKKARWYGWSVSMTVDADAVRYTVQWTKPKKK